MAEVISVKFKDTGKDYYFDPNGVTAKRGEYVIVETSKGLEYALCSAGNHQVPDEAVVPPLRPVIRVANAEDQRTVKQNAIREAEALGICRDKVARHNLDMKLISAEYSFDGSKLLFYFTSEGRVDFRDLVKELAGIFHVRIELRQVGVRDEARMLGGLGICGRPFCCSSFLDDFQPVSIKMAKTQGLSLNPAKISGTCGRLMCCLKYEQDAYEELVKNVPKVDAFVDTPAGKGSVIDVDLLRSTVRVRLEDQLTMTVKTFRADEVEVLGGKAKRAEYVAARAAEKAAADEEAEARRAAAKLRRTAEMRADLERKAKEAKEAKEARVDREEQRAHNEQQKQTESSGQSQKQRRQKQQAKPAPEARDSRNDKQQRQKAGSSQKQEPAVRQERRENVQKQERKDSAQKPERRDSVPRQERRDTPQAQAAGVQKDGQSSSSQQRSRSRRRRSGSRSKGAGSGETQAE